MDQKMSSGVLNSNHDINAQLYVIIAFPCKIKTLVQQRKIIGIYPNNFAEKKLVGPSTHRLCL